MYRNKNLNLNHNHTCEVFPIGHAQAEEELGVKIFQDINCASHILRNSNHGVEHFYIPLGLLQCPAGAENAALMGRPTKVTLEIIIMD